MVYKEKVRVDTQFGAWITQRIATLFIGFRETEKGANFSGKIMIFKSIQSHGSFWSEPSELKYTISHRDHGDSERETKVRS